LLRLGEHVESGVATDGTPRGHGERVELREKQQREGQQQQRQRQQGVSRKTAATKHAHAAARIELQRSKPAVHWTDISWQRDPLGEGGWSWGWRWS